MKKGKCIIFSAPSGSGKSTIIQFLLSKGVPMEFSISATSRAPRGQEQDKVDYYFLSAQDFKNRVDAGEFLEWEEVYEGAYYGTLLSEVARIRNKGKNVIFDLDVVGGVNVKKHFGNEALAVFIQPPSIKALKERLIARNTDSEEKIRERIGKAEFELSFASKFDTVIINDDLEKAQQEAFNKVTSFLNQ